MKNPSALVLTLACLACLGAAPATQAATQIAVNIGINAPGHYGRIDFNRYPQALLVTQQPVIYLRETVVVQQAPIYLYVPTAQQTDWGRYCRRYQACGRPVHFVREDWVRAQYGSEREERKHGKGLKSKDSDHHDHHDNGRHGGKNHDQQRD